MVIKISEVPCREVIGLLRQSQTINYFQGEIVRKHVIVKQNSPPETYSYSTIIFKFVMFIVIYVLDEIY